MGIERATFRNIMASALLGTASGILSQIGMMIVLVGTPSRQLPGFARSRWMRQGVVASAAGETLANTFVTSLPRRSSPAPLAGRIAFGAGSAALLASSRGRNVALAGAVGGGGAAISATAVTETRAALGERWPTAAPAIAEHLVALGLSVVATRLK